MSAFSSLAQTISNESFEFTNNQFDFLRHLVGEKTGIHLSDQKYDLVYGRLTRRLRALGLSNFDEYLQLIKADSNNEIENLINAITTNLTAFFRENHHFEYLTNDLLPALEAEGRLKGLRIWSAGCSTGEEAYSIAITLREFIDNIDSYDIQILASDLDSNVVNTASNGIYEEKRIEGISHERVRKWFFKGTGANAGYVKVRPELSKLITFKKLNLIQHWPMKGTFDIIFCRNVIIYFNTQTQSALFEKFAQKLNPGSHVLIGHSENLSKITDRFELIGKTVYKKLG